MSHWTSQAVSAAYSKFRPQYSAEVFETVLAAVPVRKRLIDVGCGTGQALKGFAADFEHLLGVDLSESQTAAGFQAPNVSYVVGGGEDFAVPAEFAHTTNVVTVAQALHWMNIPRFAAKCKEVLAPGGVLAVWNYQTLHAPGRVGVGIDTMDKLLMSKGYWPAERKHIDDNYATIVPILCEHFTLLKSETIEMRRTISTEVLLEYLSTWSGVMKFREKHPDADPLADLKRVLTEDYGTDGEVPTMIACNMFLFVLPK